LKQHRAKLQQDLQKVKDHLECQPSTGASSVIERRVVLEHLTALLSTMRELRDLPGFWYYLGPTVRVRFEDFQGELAALRAELRE
jgi:hypothetical protein